MSSYHIHRTEGFILGSSSHGEGDRIYAVYTRALGLVRASARSVRVERSKLRYVLQSYSLVTLSLVHGKVAWHITGAEECKAYHALFHGAPEKRLVLERVAALLGRLVQGEADNDVLFTAISSGLQALAEAPSKSAVEALEPILVLRILYLLGYLSTERPHEPLAPFAMGSEYTDDLLHAAHQSRRVIISEINASLAASHL